MSSGSVAVTVLDAEDELVQLAGWLRDEDELRGCVQLDRQPARPGQMGAVVDTLNVALTSGAAGVFAKSLFNWLARQKEAKKVTLKFKPADSLQVRELTCGSADDAEQVLKALQEFLGQGD